MKRAAVPGAELMGVLGRTLVLASTSPRRMELLSSLGIVFSVVPVAVDESISPDEPAETACLRLAVEKARSANVLDPKAWILAADTLVVVGDILLGKPRDDAEAKSMLRQLSGRDHDVWTGVAIRRMVDGRVFTGAERTRVWFDELPDAAIDTIVRSGECRDKAGAYGIQGLAGVFVSRIEGDYYNVMGLPVGTVVERLKEFS